MTSPNGARDRAVIPRGANLTSQRRSDPTNPRPLPVQDAGRVRFDRTAIKVSRRLNPAPTPPRDGESWRVDGAFMGGPRSRLLA